MVWIELSGKKYLFPGLAAPMITIVFFKGTRNAHRRVGGGVRGVRTNPLWRSIMTEEKLLNKVPVVEIHQPKKNRDINPFFRSYVVSSVKIKIVKNPWRFKILMAFHFCGKTASARKSHRKACFAIRFVLWIGHCSERRFTSNLIVQALLSFTRNYVQARLRIPTAKAVTQRYTFLFIFNSQ